MVIRAAQPLPSLSTTAVCARPRTPEGPRPGQLFRQLRLTTESSPDQLRPDGSSAAGFRIEAATRADLPDILGMIRALAEYEKLSHLCVATETDLARNLFSEPARAEVLVGRQGRKSVCFALFFHNFSTFLGKPGLYLEDLFVLPEFRRNGYGRALLIHLARLALERGCGRFEWSVLDWNESAIGFYQSLGAMVLPDWRITRVTGAALVALADRDA
jgi:GNAT superfamily N-acetyltransferase